MSQVTTPVYDRYLLDYRALLRLGIVGVLAGIFGWLFYLAITHYFVMPIFCSNPETFSICNNGGAIAWITAHIIVMVAVVVTFVQMSVYRPLLVALGVIASLWGAYAWLGGFDWYIALLWQALLFGFASMLFGWVARIPSFIISLIATSVLVVIARLVLLAA